MGNRKWPINWQFFEVWTRALAYWIGLMITDGNICCKGRSEPQQISFCNRDKSLVEFIAKNVTSIDAIKMSNRKRDKDKGLWIWDVGSIALGRKLIKFGIVPRKSTIVELPVVPAKFCWDLIRGILDGDGSVAKDKSIYFYTASEKFAQQLRNFFRGQKFNPYLYRLKTGYNYWGIRLTIDESHRLAGLMYQNNPFCLERKRARLLCH
jgi:hypothetical protein